jgi:hypothetical protein
MIKRAMKDFFTQSINAFGLAWWIEVTTESPTCIYYFGPFLTANAATESQAGYLEDLRSEGAVNIQAVVKRCQPKELTVCEEPMAASSTAL